MLQECIAKAKTWIIKEKISAVLAELDRQNVFHSKLDRSFQTLEQWEQDHAIDMKFLTTVCKPNIYSSFFQIRASEAMACVLYAIAKYYLNPEQCLIKIVNYGGDADTTAAIAGAILGALHGISWIPVRWYNRLENYSYGRDMIINIAIALSKCDFRTNDKIYDLPDNCINWNLAFSE
jgi:ADP-ribosylglycohydrolase